MSTSISPLLKFQQDGGFVDIQFNGPGYTWTNNRQGNSKILQRLDRALANSQWIMKFPFARLVHLPRVASDHCPLLLILTPNLHRRRKPFRIESWWFTLAGFKEKVKEIWLASADTPLQRRLRNMAYSLRKWASSHRLNLRARVAESINMLSKLQELPINHPNRDGEGTSITQLEDLMFKQELYWAQRAKDNWICNGDRNTKYFHMKATMRNRKNMITSLKNDAGKTVTDRVELQHLIDGHFEAFYTTPHTCDRSDSSWNIIKQHTPKISQVEANNMSAAPNMTELREALFSMKPDKSPGPDGFSARFFQANWDLVKCGLFSLVEKFFLTQEAPSSINQTNIVLIPKNDQPVTIGDYRPISLCNVTYKCLAKILANRVKTALTSLIGKEQSAFVPGRNILDNYLIVQEVLHSFKTLKQQPGAFAAKIDLAKAYDRLNWDFIDTMLQNYGFPDKLRKMINWCIRTVRFSVLTDNENGKWFQPSRGIRQGCPLSPYIFILASNALSLFLKEAALCGSLNGFRFLRTGPAITHVMYADDLFIFEKSSQNEALRIQEILNIFCTISGETINLQKSSIIFSHSTTSAIRESIQQILNIAAH
uniref:Reverse transcriptase domain-containing protein n=1 Tax=Ananas comosus var. bracteatus TaxID=296719 RepID=A0A6V7NGT2_ANACO|nr:unnamed protein product [Ananas comosus var. bracteatus]